MTLIENAGKWALLSYLPLVQMRKPRHRTVKSPSLYIMDLGDELQFHAYNLDIMLPLRRQVARDLV